MSGASNRRVCRVKSTIGNDQRHLTLRRAVLPERRTGTALVDRQLRSDMLDAGAPPRGVLKVSVGGLGQDQLSASDRGPLCAAERRFAHAGIASAVLWPCDPIASSCPDWQQSLQACISYSAYRSSFILKDIISGRTTSMRVDQHGLGRS